MLGFGWRRREMPVRKEPPPPAIPSGDDRRPQTRGAYMNGERSLTFRQWMPPLRDPREDVRSAWWRATARAIDIMQNSGWIAGAVLKANAAIMGDGLRLAAKPDPSLFGGNQAEANAWAKLVEPRFEAWAKRAYECDAAGVYNLAQQTDAALRSYWAFGEVLGQVAWIERSGAQTRTKLRLVPPHRLVQETNNVDLWQGVRVDPHGMPVAYRLRLTKPLLEHGQVVELPARDHTGRPRVFHLFSGDVGNYRGISPLVPALENGRDFSQLQRTTLRTAIVHSIMSATVKSPAPTIDVLNALQSNGEQGVGGTLDDWDNRRAGWYDGVNFDIGDQVGPVHLYAGEELVLNRSETPNQTYLPFARFLMHEFSSALGLGYPDVTGDYSGETYSSTRMRAASNWPIVLWRRRHVAGAYDQLGYECWAEEEIDAGRVPFPGGIDAFVANRTLACNADWRGPPKPQADDLKSAKADEVWYSLGVRTQEAIAADLGTDIEEVHAQLAREKASREENGLPEPAIIAPPKPENDSEDNQADESN